MKHSRLNQEAEDHPQELDPSQASEGRLNAVIDAIDDVVFEIDESGVYRNVWAADEKLLLKPKSQLIGHRVDEFIAPALAAQFREIMARTLATGKAESLEYGLDLAGRAHWFGARISPIRRSGAGSRSVCMLVRDVTDRKRMEQALAAEKERLAVTLRSIADGVITTDVSGRVALLNRVAEALVGWTQEEAFGRPLSEVFRILDGKTRTPVETPQSAVATANEVWLVARDGAERWISQRVSPIFGVWGEILGVVFVIQDMTDRQSREVEMVRAAKIESLALLAGGIAHDFNNLLTVILGNVSLGRFFVPDRKDVQDRLAQAEVACLRAKDLTQQLLDFSKGGSPVKRADSIVGLIRDSTDFALRGSKVKAEVGVPDDLWPVEADPTQLRQVVSHLTLNAAGALPDGGMIRIRAANFFLTAPSSVPLPEGCYVRISFQDEGVTLSHEQLPQMFEPYFKASGRASGMVLATVYAIVKAHGGLVRVESEADHGTTFEVYLPALREPCPARSRSDGSPDPSAGRVLVMDDDPQIRELIQAGLGLFGYDVEVASDGGDAVRRYCEAKSRGQPFAAVVLDLTIPGGMGGRETVQRLQTIDPEIKAIVSSGYLNDPVLGSFADFGFSAVVRKPYQINELAQTLERLVRPKRA